MSAHKEHKQNPGHDFFIFFLDPLPLILTQSCQPGEPDLKIQVEFPRLPHASTETHRLTALLITKAATEGKQRWGEGDKVKNFQEAAVTKASTVPSGGKSFFTDDSSDDVIL